MTRAKQRPARAIDAVRQAIEREREKRRDDLKPIEIVKAAVCAYQSYYPTNEPSAACVESDDRAGIRRGTQSSVDRLLFNVNYWLSAYEDDIVSACPQASDAQRLLRGIAAWNSHTMKLNKLSASETAALFERFCPPFALNNRRGKASGSGAGKGPVHDFRQCVSAIAPSLPDAQSDMLARIVDEVEAESRVYGQFADPSPLDAYYELLPAWCLQDRIELVRAQWWNDPDVMMLIAERVGDRFSELGYAQPLCAYYRDVMRESIYNYMRTIDSEDSPYRATPVSELLELIRAARAAHPAFEVEGYGNELPAWLDSKEQLIWNTVACAIYGPMYARPLLAENLGSLPTDDRPPSIDVITELAQHAYRRYLSIRAESGIQPKYSTFNSQPHDLRVSGLERIESIPDMLRVLGYRIVPLASCYPEQRIETLKPSEVECLAILEHRRWCGERTAAGWTYAPTKNVESKLSPFLVDWDDLPDYAREWNRDTARDIPELLAKVGLAISK